MEYNVHDAIAEKDFFVQLYHLYIHVCHTWTENR